MQLDEPQLRSPLAFVLTKPSLPARRFPHRRCVHRGYPTNRVNSMVWIPPPRQAAATTTTTIATAMTTIATTPPLPAATESVTIVVVVVAIVVVVVSPRHRHRHAPQPKRRRQRPRVEMAPMMRAHARFTEHGGGRRPTIVSLCSFIPAVACGVGCWFLLLCKVCCSRASARYFCHFPGPCFVFLELKVPANVEGSFNWRGGTFRQRTYLLKNIVLQRHFLRISCPRLCP
jgi:hypothetical protein